MPRSSIISAIANDAAGGGGVGPDGTQNYVEVTIASTQVASTLTDFPVYVDLSDLPAAFFTNVQADGGDIRVTESDGFTRCPVDLVAIDTGGSTGELHFLASSLSSSSDTVYRIYYNATSTLSQPGVATTYGRNAVWSDYEAVYHMGEDPSGPAPQIVDSTGNSHDGTSNGSMTGGDSITAQLGNGLDFDGTDDYINIGSFSGGASIAAGYTLSAWAQGESTANPQAIIGGDDSEASSQQRIFQYRLDADGTPRLIRFDSSENVVASFAAATALTDAPAWHRVTAVFDNASGSVIYVDGASDATDADTTNNGTWQAEPIYLGGRLGAPSFTAFFKNGLDEIRIRPSAVSSDWEASEYTNQNTPTTFYTVGSQQPA